MKRSAAEWASVARADALGALSRVAVPVLVVHADAPWNGAPYVYEATIEAQIAAARDSRLYVASGQHHGDIIRRPSDGLVHALKELCARPPGQGTRDSTTIASSLMGP